MGRQKNKMKWEAGFDFRGSAVSSWMEAIDLSEEGVSEITRDFGLEGRKRKYEDGQTQICPEIFTFVTLTLRISALWAS